MALGPLATQVGLMLPVAGLALQSEVIVQLLEQVPCVAIAPPKAGWAPTQVRPMAQSAADVHLSHSLAEPGGCAALVGYLQL
jgi:hypothetical protein